MGVGFYMMLLLRLILLNFRTSGMEFYPSTIRQWWFLFFSKYLYHFYAIYLRLFLFCLLRNCISSSQFFFVSRFRQFFRDTFSCSSLHCRYVSCITRIRVRTPWFINYFMHSFRFCTLCWFGVVSPVVPMREISTFITYLSCLNFWGVGSFL